METNNNLLQTERAAIELMIKEGQRIIAERDRAEFIRHEKEKGELHKSFSEIMSKVRGLVPPFIIDNLQYNDGDISELVLQGRSWGFCFKGDRMFPIYLSIETRNTLSVEYIVPALMVDGSRAFIQDITDENPGSVFKDEKMIQTENVAVALYYARQRWEMMGKVQEELDACKPEPEYEPIEKTAMVNPSLDDLINLKISEALKKALA